MTRLPSHPNVQSTLGAFGKLLWRQDLECRNNGSDKVYIVEVAERSDSPGSAYYTAFAFYGKRTGSSLKSNLLYSGGHLSAAIRKAQAQTEAKRRGSGSSTYTFVHTEDHNSSVFGTATPPNHSFEALTPTMRPPAMPPLTPQIPSELKRSEARTMLIGMPMNKNEYDLLPPDAALKILKREPHLVEFIPALKFLYGILHKDRMFLFRIEKDGPVVDEEFVMGVNDSVPLNTKMAGFNEDVGFLCIRHGADELALMDVFHVPDIDRKLMTQWKKRRTMLTQIFDQLYPGVDPYDTANRITLTDYYYQDKVKYFASYKGIAIIRSANSTFGSKMIVTTK